MACCHHTVAVPLGDLSDRLRRQRPISEVQSELTAASATDAPHREAVTARHCWAAGCCTPEGPPASLARAAPGFFVPLHVPILPRRKTHMKSPYLEDPQSRIPSLASGQPAQGTRRASAWGLWATCTKEPPVSGIILYHPLSYPDTRAWVFHSG